MNGRAGRLSTPARASGAGRGCVHPLPAARAGVESPGPAAARRGAPGRPFIQPSHIVLLYVTARATTAAILYAAHTFSRVSICEHIDRIATEIIATRTNHRHSTLTQAVWPLHLTPYGRPSATRASQRQRRKSSKYLIEATCTRKDVKLGTGRRKQPLQCWPQSGQSTGAARAGARAKRSHRAMRRRR